MSTPATPSSWSSPYGGVRFTSTPLGEMVEIGDPTTTTWRDQLIKLLHIDAAIEHGLMAAYLYAAYSLADVDLPANLDAAAREGRRRALTGWQEEILAIAKEEMGHLVMVQNVLSLLGAPLCLSREDFPWDSQFYPFPIKLEPLSRGSLAAYVVAEMPKGWLDGVTPAAAGDTGALTDDAFVKRRLLADLTAYLGYAPTPEKPIGVNRVGALFNAVLAILEDPERLPDRHFNDNRYGLQAQEAEWAKYFPSPTQERDAVYRDNPELRQGNRTGDAQMIIQPLATRDEAVTALKLVAHQGESPDTPVPASKAPTQGARSHFERFFAIYKEWLTLGIDANPAARIPVNPTEIRVDERRDPGISTYIADARSNRWAKLFNLRYRLLLTSLGHTLQTQRHADCSGTPGLRGTLNHLCFGEMYNLKAIANILVRSPRDSRRDPKRAGPPFQMPYGTQLPAAELDRWLLYADILEASQSITSWLLDGDSNQAERAYLTHLSAMDRNTLTMVNGLIARFTLTKGAE
ncbi:ferritin-like domain-containing protein [Azospirillum sp.]|uniref:ferritin-like domain-containing protein n=1 Tax=Azospirillum sp. TaxID=34012 RepID=UPI002609044B|nr:ferritin-like domain-containing protein [Azospirillum sp.]